MKNKKIFEDGSSVEWVDKETLKYSEGIYSVLIWVDFEPCFFARGRIIRPASVMTWETRPTGSAEIINEKKKAEILNKVKNYYKSFSIKCRIEEEKGNHV